MTSSKSNKTPKHRQRRSPGGANKPGRAAPPVGGKQGRGRSGKPSRAKQSSGAQASGKQSSGELGRAQDAALDNRGSRTAGALRSREDADRPSGSQRRGRRRADDLRGRPLVSSNRPPPGGGRLGGLTKTNAPTATAPPKRKAPAPAPTTPPPTAPPPDWAPGVDVWADPDESPPSSQRTQRADAPDAGRSYPSSHETADAGDFGMLGIGTRVLPPDMEFELFEEDSSVIHPVPTPDAETVEERIRELEARLDGMMTTVATPPSAPRPTTEGSDPRRGEPREEELTEANAVEAARELLQNDYYRRKWGRASLRAHMEEVDDFGLAPEFEERVLPLLKFLFRYYFRVETKGIDNIPSEGRAVVVANHSGTLPLDGVILRQALREHHPATRDLRWLAEDFVFYLPFIGVTLNRIGAVRACQENAQRLLAKDHLIAVFPEGTKGIKKLYRQRYQLQRFGRGGYIRLCLRTQSPLIPCAIVGAEETNPMLYRLDNLSRLLGLQYLPVTPTFPWLGPLGLVPAPTKWRVTFGEPIALDGYGPEAADDHVLIGRLSERVRASISSMLEGSLRARRSVWL